MFYSFNNFLVLFSTEKGESHDRREHHSMHLLHSRIATQKDHIMRNLQLNNCDKAKLDKDISKLVQLMCDCKIHSYPDGECSTDFTTNDSYISLRSAVSDFTESLSNETERQSNQDFRLNTNQTLSPQSGFINRTPMNVISKCIALCY